MFLLRSAMAGISTNKKSNVLHLKWRMNHSMMHWYGNDDGAVCKWCGTSWRYFAKSSRRAVLNVLIRNDSHWRVLPEIFRKITVYLWIQFCLPSHTWAEYCPRDEHCVCQYAQAKPWDAVRAQWPSDSQMFYHRVTRPGEEYWDVTHGCGEFDNEQK